MTDKFILESFWQKKANCATIAIIKAAILKYGLNKVFKVNQKLGTCLVVLKDKKLLTLTDTEINRINRRNDIVFSRYKNPGKKKQLDKLRKYVRFCFAVIVRNIQLNGYDGKEYTQSAAIHELIREGLNIEHLHSLLGLYRKTTSAHKLVRSHLPILKRKKAVLLYNPDHIVVLSGGYYEDYGTAVPIGNEFPILKGKKARSWYELK